MAQTLGKQQSRLSDSTSSLSELESAIQSDNQSEFRRDNVLASWNDNLNPDNLGLSPSPSKSLASHSSVVDDLGISHSIADNRTSSQAKSNRLSQASLVSHATGGAAANHTKQKDHSFPEELRDTSRENGFTKIVEQQDLGRSIRAALQTSQSKGKQDFLPDDVLSRIVTCECVRYQLNHHNVCPEEELDQLTSKVWNVTTPHPPSKSIYSRTRPKETTRRKIFAILGLMNKFKAIVDFIDSDLYDNDLPFSLSEGAHPGDKQLTRKGKDDKGNIEFFENWETFELEYFNSNQWRFTAPYFHSAESCEKPQHYPLENDTILPFIEDEEVSGSTERAEGGFSDVWRVKIHPAHHNLCHSSNPSYAVKRLRSSKREPFNQEVSNLKRFSDKDHLHLTKLLVTFSWRDQYYLLFPWAESNLLSYWKQNPSPLNPKRDRNLAVWLSEQCLGVAQGLKMIHTLDIPSDLANGVGDQNYGRHGDLKPENILWFKEYDHTKQGGFGTLKISDFGLTRFHGEGSKSHREIVPLTGTYRPPEYDIAKIVSQSYDIWSLGCLLLEFVTWYLLGWEEVDNFSKARMKDDTQSPLPQDIFFLYLEIEDDNGKPQMGARAKSSVAKEFNKLYHQPGRSDYTLELLAFIEDSLIRIDPTKRANCGDIVKKLTELNQKCLSNEKYCTECQKTPPERSGTELSELSASALELSMEQRDRIRKRGSLLRRTELVKPPDYSSPSAISGKVYDKESVYRAASPNPPVSTYRSPTVRSGHSSTGTQSSSPQSPNKKTVHFDSGQQQLLEAGSRSRDEYSGIANNQPTILHHEEEEQREFNYVDTTPPSSPLEITSNPIFTPSTEISPTIYEASEHSIHAEERARLPPARNSLGSNEPGECNPENGDPVGTTSIGNGGIQPTIPIVYGNTSEHNGGLNGNPSNRNVKKEQIAEPPVQTPRPKKGFKGFFTSLFCFNNSI